MTILPDIFEHDTLDVLTCNPSSGLMQLAAGALPCDAWHHYYHYQSSAQYLWLAETLRALGKNDEALKAYDRAVFQDHFNQDALDGKKRAGETRAPSYDKHAAFDLEFRSLVGELPDDATKLHDKGALALQAGDIARALTHFEDAIAISRAHSNSHFGRGRCYFLLQEYEKAAQDLSRAITLSHERHDLYHRAASAEHLARGREFLGAGKPDLAINDFTKALDLHQGNKEALKARAGAYRAKGNEKLAEEDERKL